MDKMKKLNKQNISRKWNNVNLEKIGCLQGALRGKCWE